MKADGTRRVVVLGNGREVTLGNYVLAWHAAKALPPDQPVKHGLRGWWQTTAGEVLAEFREGLHDRINRHDPAHGKGRTWDHDWQRETLQAARQLNTPRLVIHWLPGWLRRRFGHRIWKEEAA